MIRLSFRLKIRNGLNLRKMSENPIIISNLNDFIFCPVSIYFHSLEPEKEELLAKDTHQINGSDAHKKSDTAAYSTKKSMLQGISVYSSKYDICGKIDTFDCENGILTERKKKITAVYNGYIFQLYAQYFALSDMGYRVFSLRLYSMDDNKLYKIKRPEEDPEMLAEFEGVIADMKSFDFGGFKQSNMQKCMHCIYEPLCNFSVLKECD